MIKAVVHPKRDAVVVCVFSGGPALITAIGFAIKTEVYDGRDNDCVFT